MPPWTRSCPLARPSWAFVPQCGTNSFRRFPSGSSVHLHHFTGVTGDAAVGEKVRRVGEDGVEAAFGIFGGDGVQEFQTVSMIKPDFFGRKNQAGSWVLAFWFLGTRNPGTWTRNPNNLAVFAEGEMGRSEEFGSWEFEVGSLGNGSRGSPQSGTGCSPHRFWLSTLDPRLSTGFGGRTTVKRFCFSCHLPLGTCHPFSFGWRFGLLRHAQIN